MAGYHSEYPPYVWAFVESCQIFAQITTTAQDQGDPRFPKMIAILERMFETLGQMLRESMNRHVIRKKIKVQYALHGMITMLIILTLRAMKE